jgi:hypothetical protein
MYYNPQDESIYRLPGMQVSCIPVSPFRRWNSVRALTCDATSDFGHMAHPYHFTIGSFSNFAILRGIHSVGP